MTKTSIFILLVGAVVGFLGGYFVAEPLRGGLIAALQPILTNPASAAALIAAFLAFIAGVGGPLVAFFIGSKQAKAAQTSADAALNSANSAGARALANVRLKWLQALRETLSEYHSILMSAKDEDPAASEEAKAKAQEKMDADERRLSYLGTQLDLLLNQKKVKQQALWKVSDEILNMPTRAQRQDADPRLIAAARDVLDFHWKKIKAEILGKESATEQECPPPTPAPPPKAG
jgi:hypothetical protein